VVGTADVPLEVAFIVDSPHATTGQCGEKTFAATSCTFTKSGKTLTCK